MRPRAFVSLSLMTLAIGACQDEIIVADAFSPTPLRDLTGVALGMSVDDLRSARPAAVFSPYRGYYETLGDVMVAYDFNTHAASESEVGRWARLETVSLGRPAESAMDAREQFRAAVDAATARYGAPARCAEIRGHSPGTSAVWMLEEGVLNIAVRGPLDTGPETLPDRVIFTVAKAMRESRHLDAVPVPCSSIA